MKKNRTKHNKSSSNRPISEGEIAEPNELQEYDYHLPVMLGETISLLNIKPNGCYIDGTLGGGGHTREIFTRLDSGRLYSFDQDEGAIEYCRGAFSDELQRGEQSRLHLVNANFSQFKLACSTKTYKEEQTGSTLSPSASEGELLTSQKERPIPFIDGMLLDLGVSSRQLDTGDRGISYRFSAPLDMRFGGNAELITARDLLHSSDEQTLTRILREYGEEPFARPIARQILSTRTMGRMETTDDLRHAVEQAMPKHLVGKAMARVFQAFRIAVNGELDVLEETLSSVLPYLNTGGRVVVITYHSLEDRIVKHRFKELSTTIHARQPGEITIHAPAHLLTTKPLYPTDEEIRRNPRARSAKVRAIEKAVVE